MPQYLMSVLHDSTDLASDDEMAAIDVFNEQLQAEGHWVFAGGLASPTTATVVDGRHGEPVFTDGPYLESKEYLAGFWIIEAPHLDVALRLAASGRRAATGGSSSGRSWANDRRRRRDRPGYREEWARVVATLARRFGDLDIAEEMTAEAFAIAVARWPVDGVPPNPGAWLTTTAHRKAIDRLRREARREGKTGRR